MHPLPAVAAGLISHRPATLRRAAPAPTADFRHVSAIYADLLPALATGGPGLIRGKLMRLPLFVSGPASLAGDLLLPLAVHRRKPAILRAGLMLVLIGHFHGYVNSLQRVT
jgi:hypothetical protein